MIGSGGEQQLVHRTGRLYRSDNGAACKEKSALRMLLGLQHDVAGLL
jgi:hypothetical protein